jgi:uncharacterized protein YecE (DUF72 family)
MLRIGTAGWSIPKAHAAAFPQAGTHLARYAAVLPCVEINTSFYRPHRPATYARWAASVPPGFRFAVKLPRAITHEARLANTEPLLDAFLTQATALGPALGPLLVQLPPSLPFRPGDFFAALRARHDGDIACEPRHPSWFTPEATAHLLAHRIARVAADPAIILAAAEPAAWPGLAYWRLHGSPRMYRSDYGPARLAALAPRLSPAAWVILDNTTEGHAMADALALLRGTAR